MTMMSPRKSIALVALGAGLWLAGVAFVNYRIDPFCYRCPEIDGKHRTRNNYFSTVQRIPAHPETEQILLGTSHGLVVPVDWIERRTGFATLNLSAGGADVFVKLAFLRLAREKTKLRSVIWISDYFEFLKDIHLARFLESPALRKYVGAELGDNVVTRAVERLSLLVDHNTFEAALAALKNPGAVDTAKGGPPSCPERASEPFTDELLRLVNVSYSGYADGTFLRDRSPAAWRAFVAELRELDREGIRVLILVPPVHPLFRERFRRNRPLYYERQLAWVRELRALEGGNVRVASFLEGLPNDEPGPHLWNDGDHFSCQAAKMMLQAAGL